MSRSSRSTKTAKGIKRLTTPSAGKINKGAAVKKQRAKSLTKKLSIEIGISMKDAGKLLKNKDKPRTRRGLWPAEDLFFKTFPDDNAYEMWYSILLERGWKFAGITYDGDDINILEKLIKKPQPKRCLWLVEETEGQILAKLPENGMIGGRHKISAILGSESANYKTNITLKLNNKPYYPDSYSLPKEKDRFLQQIAKESHPLWIYKPKNDYGGNGCTVYDINSKAFKNRMEKDLKQRRYFVLQRYIENPVLLGEYKFHLRVFVIITKLKPLTGFLHSGGQVLFSTKPYRDDEGSFGDSFDKYSHLTNWSIHHLSNNHEALLRKKPVVGVGCEWRWKRFISYMKRTFPKFSEVDMTRQLVKISRDVIHAISTHENVKRMSNKMVPDRHFEIFGLDVMLDDQFKCWLLESNSSPGLMPSPDKVPIPNSKRCRINQGAREATKDTYDIMHDMFTLLGFDDYQKHGKLKNWIKL